MGIFQRKRGLKPRIFIFSMPLFFLAAILSFAADQFAKLWIRSRLPEGDSLSFLPGVMHLEHVKNYGAAWGILSGQKWLLIVFTLVVVGVIGRSAREVAARGALSATGFGLRYDTPIGPVRFDLGWRWKASDPMRPSFAWFLSISESFF